MPCFKPLVGYMAKVPNKSGKFSVVFNINHGWADRQVNVPCGRCIGCRLERSKQWAIRCVHEASLYKSNCFITLTFNDKFLDSNSSLVKSDFQKFMKRLRKRFGSGVRYFHCGEYGSKLSRPHHHACLFNFDFEDKVLWSVRNGVKLYRSKSLEDLWPFGFCTVGEVTFESAAYVARYVTKKITGDIASDHYGGRVPEYVTMSRRPGIASAWFEKFSSDVFPSDSVVVRGGIVCKPPRFYDNKYDLSNHSEMSIIKGKREKLARSNPDYNVLKRLRTRERCQSVKMQQLRRQYEVESV